MARQLGRVGEQGQYRFVSFLPSFPLSNLWDAQLINSASLQLTTIDPGENDGTYTPLSTDSFEDATTAYTFSVPQSGSAISTPTSGLVQRSWDASLHLPSAMLLP
jgi:hypothetical protein